MTDGRADHAPQQCGSQSAFVRGFIDDSVMRWTARCGGKSQSAFVRGFIDDLPLRQVQAFDDLCLNPRSCAASSMTLGVSDPWTVAGGLNPRSCAASSMTTPSGTGASRRWSSQSAFVRGFIDDRQELRDIAENGASQSAFVRGFIDDCGATFRVKCPVESQSAFVRGFIDDCLDPILQAIKEDSLNPRSCAASSMTWEFWKVRPRRSSSQSAFVRGFIDDPLRVLHRGALLGCLNPRSCAASSMTDAFWPYNSNTSEVSIRVRARLHR